MKWIHVIQNIRGLIKVPFLEYRLEISRWLATLTRGKLREKAEHSPFQWAGFVPIPSLKADPETQLHH